MTILIITIAAIDSLLGKRRILLKIKNRVVINISIEIFRFIHKSFSSKIINGKNCIRKKRTYIIKSDL